MAASGPGGTSFTARKYVYDALKGILTDIKLNGSTTTLASDGNFGTTRINLPGGGVDSLQRGSLHEPVKHTKEAGNNNNLERWIGIDTLGRIDRHLRQAAKIGRWFTYDSLSQLRKGANRLRTPDGTIGGCPTGNYGMSGSCTPSADYVALDSVMYAYDAVGNRTDHSGAYGTGNRITTFGNCTYTTDADGNVTARTGGSCAGAATLFWTAEGQLDSVHTGSTGIKYRYDASGRLVQKRVNGSSSSYFLWDGDNLLAELNGSASAINAEYSYYPGLDHPHALIKGGTRYYARRDGLGSVLALTDSAKVVKRTYTYDDWGLLTAGYDSAGFNGVDRMRWKGALWLGGEVDVYYMRHRWYEPSTGRFLSEDPIGLAGGMNLFVYAGNEPASI